jgi:type II secretory pathway pseudopilin PulG
MDMQRRDAGLTIVELTIAALILAVGALFVTEALQRSEGASRADTNLAQAVRSGDGCLRLLGQELSQSTAQIDTELPPGEQQRLWVLPNGVRFQKVVGQEFDDFGTASQRWSEDIVYVHDPATGELWRTPAGGTGERLSRGVVDFDVARTSEGQIVVTLETRAGSASRGVEGKHRRTVRFTPLNALR